MFINSGCHFQDQGGIRIGNGVLIGHNVVLATLNHDVHPYNRASMHPAPIVIGDRVWIGSNATVVPGVTIGENSIDVYKRQGLYRAFYPSGCDYLCGRAVRLQPCRNLRRLSAKSVVAK